MGQDGPELSTKAALGHGEAPDSQVLTPCQSPAQVILQLPQDTDDCLSSQPKLGPLQGAQRAHLQPRPRGHHFSSSEAGAVCAARFGLCYVPSLGYGP